MPGLFDDLLEPDYGIDNSPEQDIRITQVILYYDEHDAESLKELAKEAMKIEMPGEFINRGNLSDLYLLILKKHYGTKNNMQTSSF